VDWNLLGLRVKYLLRGHRTSLDLRASHARDAAVLSSEIARRVQVEKLEKLRSQTLELLIADLPLGTVLDTILAGVVRINPALLGCMFLLDRATRKLFKVAERSRPDFELSVQDGIEAAESLAAWSRADEAGTLPTHACWQRLRHLAGGPGFGACWSKPVRAATGEVLGLFVMSHGEHYAVQDSDRRLLEQSAYLSGIAMERHSTVEALRDSEERFRSVMEKMPGVAVQGYALDGSVKFWNRASESLYGYSEAEAMGANPLHRVMTADAPQSVGAAMQTRTESGQPMPDGEMLLTRKDGSSVPVFSSHVLINALGGQPELFRLDIDLSERKQAQEKLQLAANVFTHTREGIMITDAHGSIIDVNSAFTRITGYARDEVLGRDAQLLNSERQEPGFHVNLWRRLRAQGHWDGEIFSRRKNGEEFVAMKTISAVRDDMGETQQYVALFSDITTFKEHEQQLKQIAHFDVLTRLPNRTLLADRLQQALSQSQRRGKKVAVVFLDLDGFKAVNDRHGHEAGDHLLVAVATRMKQVLRGVDTLARIGGDEFVAVLADLSEIGASGPMLTRLLKAAAQPVQFGDITLQVSASLGVSFYPQAEAVDADLLLRQADQAMYQAKLAGKNRYHVFDAEHDRRLRGNHESLAQIRQALADREFVLYYQPKVNMRSGKVIGAEALIRWQHPQQGILPPALFLPVIERHSLSIDLGEWVIDTALSQMETWHAAGLDIPVSVNVGACQLQHEQFVPRLRTILNAHPNVTPGRLELELLETSEVADLAQIAQVIEACQSMGVMFALDDFGTGYSSLTYLKRLPVKLLKIDQSFVRGMLDDMEDLAILEGVIGLSRAFRCEVIAEGVETLEHGAMLLQLGCELAQGYGIARPMPAQALPEWAASWSPCEAWTHLPVTSRDDLPLLFAGVEHRAWIKGMENYIGDKREAAPLLDHQQSHFGVWLQGKGLERHGSHQSFASINTLHQQTHALARTLCALKARGDGVQALAGMGELHGLGATLLERMQALGPAH
jgi:diguanylate cyclase (GGDEF)-like protein/PAS domain S-box-containing protein